MTDIEQAARRMLLRARKQAEELLAEAQKEAETIKESARVEGKREGTALGHAEGLKTGQEEGHAEAHEAHALELSETIAALVKAMSDFDAHRQELETEGIREVVHLAISIARRVTKRQGQIDPAVLTANLAEAMRLVVHKADVRVAVHPQQRATLEAALPKLKLQWPSMKHVELMDDPELSPGGCRVVTAHGQIDADLDSQLDRVVADLLPSPNANDLSTGGVPA